VEDLEEAEVKKHFEIQVGGFRMEMWAKTKEEAIRIAHDIVNDYRAEAMRDMEQADVR